MRFPTLRIVDAPPLPTLMVRARSNAPSSPLAPASSATRVTICTAAVANGALPPSGSPRVGQRESPQRLLSRSRRQLDQRLLSLRSTSQQLCLAVLPSRIQLTTVQAPIVVRGCLILGVSAHVRSGRQSHRNCKAALGRPSCASPFRPPITLSTAIWSLGNKSGSSMKSQSRTVSTRLLTCFL